MAKPCEPPTEYGTSSLSAIRAGKIQLTNTVPNHTLSKHRGRHSFNLKGIPYPGEAAFSSESGVPTNMGSSNVRRTVPPSPNIAVDSSSPSSTLPLLYNIPVFPLRFNLPDLLDLERCGEKVVWPVGFSAVKAAAFMADYEWAVRVGGLYAFIPSDTPADESTTIQFSQPLSRHPAAEESDASESVGVAPSLPTDPGEIFKTLKPPKPPPPNKRIRKCVNLTEYYAKKQRAPGSGAASSAQSHFDDPDASFSEGSLSEGED